MACEANLLLLLNLEMFMRGKVWNPVIAGKTYDYLRSGTRILAPLQEGDAADLIRHFNAGIVVSPRDVNAIAKALAGEIEAWKQGERKPPRTPRADLQEYERKSLTGRLAEVLREAAGQTK